MSPTPEKFGVQNRCLAESVKASLGTQAEKRRGQDRRLVSFGVVNMIIIESLIYFDARKLVRRKKKCVKFKLVREML